MRTLGLLGGMSWESTVTYYQQINRQVRKRLGNLHSAECIVYSFDFEEIERCQSSGDWKHLETLLCDGANRLKRGGAEGIVICTNTMHKLAPSIKSHTELPVLHIASETGKVISQASYTHVGLLGTRYTMEQDFYKSRLVDEFGLDVMVPNDADRDTVHSIIYSELCNGIVKTESRTAYIDIIHRLADAGAECVILGCTEIGLLISSADVRVPVFDTALIHAQAAADWAIDSANSNVS